MTADVDHVVDASHDPEVAIFVPSSAIAGKVNILNLRPVLLAITVVVAPDSPQHRWPGTLDNQIAALVCAHFLPVTRHHGNIDSRERFSCGPGLGRRRAR